MSNLRNDNAVKTLEMYRKRLIYLQKQIVSEAARELDKIQKGYYYEEAAFFRLNEFKDELDYIEECIDILEHLKKEG